MPRAVARFKTRHPRHTVVIREGTTASLAAALGLAVAVGLGYLLGKAFRK